MPCSARRGGHDRPAAGIIHFFRPVNRLVSLGLTGWAQLKWGAGRERPLGEKNPKERLLLKRTYGNLDH